MNVNYNGKNISMPVGSSLRDLLTLNSTAVKGVLVEFNDEILDVDADYAQFILHENDQVNAFRIVAGG